MPPEITDLIAGNRTGIIISVCGGLLFTAVITIVVIVFIKRMVSPNAAIMKNGIPAQAKILSLTQTGTYVNNQPQVMFQLEVHPPGGTPYQTTTKAVIPLTSIPQVQPGAVVAIKIDPKDSTKVVLGS